MHNRGQSTSSRGAVLTAYNVTGCTVAGHKYAILYTDNALTDVPAALKRWVLADWHPFDIADGLRMAEAAKELMTITKGA